MKKGGKSLGVKDEEEEMIERRLKPFFCIKNDTAKIQMRSGSLLVRVKG